jgi:thioredoxin-related protein
VKNLFGNIATLLLSILLSAPVSAESHISYTKDWLTESVEAQKTGVPIMMVFGSEYCAYCARLKAEVLEPGYKTGAWNGRVHIREIDIDSGGKVTDFDGEPVRSRIFVSRYDIYATPTVVMVDYEGTPISEPIVGFSDAKSYLQQLDSAIDAADLTLASKKPPTIGRLK